MLFEVLHFETLLFSELFWQYLCCKISALSKPCVAPTDSSTAKIFFFCANLLVPRCL